MSLNALRFGLNLTENKKKHIKHLEEKLNEIQKEETLKNELFPDCSHDKKIILGLEKNFEILKSNNDDISKVKEEKLKILNEKIHNLKTDLFNKLSIGTKNYDEINPLCSFQEMKIECKFRKEFLQIMSEKYKYSVPSPIQSCVIPLLNKKQNVIGSSETGSGKTLSYLIPLIHNILLNKLKSEDCKEKLPHKALIILPTKELCMQIYNECLVFCKYYTKNNIKVKYFTQAMFNSVTHDFDSFLKNNDIIIATPKKAIEIINLQGMKFAKEMLYLILDEADKFFDMGFIEYIDQILQATRDNTFTVKGFFSATIVSEIEDIILSNIIDAVKVEIGSVRAPARTIHQKFTYCTNEDGKLIALRNFFKDNFEPPMIIFVEGIKKQLSLYEEIKFDFPKISYLHSKMSKNEREESIKKFRCGETWILICTDLLSRGIDFKNVKTVLNYDCPYNPINYIHKIGRTGRAGKIGKAFTFIIDNDIKKLRSLSNMLNMIKNNLDCPQWILKLKDKKFQLKVNEKNENFIKKQKMKKFKKRTKKNE